MKLLMEMCINRVEVCKREEENILIQKGDAKKLWDVVQKDDLVINRLDVSESDGKGKKYCLIVWQ